MNQLQDANNLNEQELFNLALEHFMNNEMGLMEQVVDHLVSIGFSRDEIIEEMISKMEVGQ